jgi:hypothetical protein
MAQRPYEISLLSLQPFHIYEINRRISLPKVEYAEGYVRLGWIGGAHSQVFMGSGVIIPLHDFN